MAAKMSTRDTPPPALFFLPSILPMGIHGNAFLKLQHRLLLYFYTFKSIQYWEIMSLKLQMLLGNENQLPYKFISSECLPLSNFLKYTLQTWVSDG